MSQRIKVLFVCQWYQPEPVSQPGWIVDALGRQDLDVEVLTGIPNYPSGEVADGYAAWRPRTEERDGIRVRRAPLFPSHDANAAKRLFNYVSWAACGVLFGWRELRGSDATLVYSSPATAALPAIVGKRLFGVPYILLIQDVWPDSIFASGFLSGRIRRLAERLTVPFINASYRHATHVAVTSPGMAQLLEARGVPRHKLSVVFNWVDDRQAAVDCDQSDLRVQLGLASEAFVLMYAGNHGPAQALGAAIEAFSAPDAPDTHLVLVGDGIEKSELQSQVAARGIRRVHFLESVPRNQMAGLMRQADAQLVSLARRPLFAVTTPSKLQSVMAAGQPVVVAADGDAAAVVGEADAGYAAPAEDAQQIRLAVERMARLDPSARALMGKRGQKYYEQHMAAGVGAARLAALLRSAARARASN